MYTIEDMLYGFKMTFVSRIEADEMQRFLVDADNIMKDSNKTNFRVLIDMREANLGGPLAEQKWSEGVQLFRKMGMANSLVLGLEKTSTMEDYLLKKAS